MGESFRATQARKPTMGKIDFGRLARDAADSARKLLDPRDIFNALPAKSTDLDYLRGPQDQVLEQWHRRRDSRDLVIKMNTGGGKTLVGLLIARSQLNEGLGPVAYLVPDHYLASQVCAEAERLGIETTSDPRAFAYASGRAVLVDVSVCSMEGQSSALPAAPGARLRCRLDRSSSMMPTPASPKLNRSSA